MSHLDQGPKALASKTRTLEEAARIAYQIAASEHPALHIAYDGDPERWHRERILKTVPVYGTRNRHTERVADQDLRQYSALTVRPADFRRYMDWLQSF